MKKLISVLILLVTLFAFAGAEKKEPIIGAWYAFFDMDASPQTKEFENYDKTFIVYLFEEDGAITAHEIDIMKDGEATLTSFPCGEWKSRIGNMYNIKIIGAGEHNVRLKDNTIEVPVLEQNGNYIFYKLYKTTEFDWYNDMKVKLK